MQILYGFLTVLMFLDCVLLILLVLLQLPKKEAGAGMAFGGGAADALFGAGSGNVLTKITKWLAGVFFALGPTLGSGHAPLGQGGVDVSSFESKVKQQQQQAPAMSPAPAPPAPVARPAAGTSNTLQL